MTKCRLGEKWLVLDTELKINVQVLRKMAHTGMLWKIGNDHRGIVSVCITSAEEVWVNQG